MSTPLYSKDGVYISPRPPISLPHDPEISMVPFLFRHFSSIAQTTALIDSETGKILTFSDLKKQVSKLSNALLNLKISKNDVVFIFSQNSILFPVSFLAVVGIGAIATTANPQYTAGEVTKQANDSNPKLIITTHELYHKIMHLNLPCIILSPKTSVHIKVKPNVPIWYFSDLIESSDSSELLPLPSVLQTDVAALLYSSGTTGTSKGVVLTHRNFIATSLMVTSDQEVYRDPKNVFLCFLPLFHIFGLAVVLYAQLQRGNAVVVMAKYEMEKMLMAIEKHKVAHMFVAPPVVIELAKRPEVVKKYDVSSLKEIGSGAAPLGKEVMEDCDKIFAEAVIYQGYGMTETCGIISLENTKIGSHHSGSTGVLVPGVESQIIDINSMKSLPPFHKGEIWVRGQNMMQGYLKNPKAPTETIDEQGWVHTGDLGYFDDAGRLYVVDRLKELIKCKGYQVAPAELEELLLTHPEITDAAVIPWEDPKAGEVPIAYVVRSSNSSLSQEHVKRFISEQVAQFKRLQRVIFIDNIPKSASGKILRRELRQKNLSKL